MALGYDWHLFHSKDTQSAVKINHASFGHSYWNTAKFLPKTSWDQVRSLTKSVQSECHEDLEGP